MSQRHPFVSVVVATIDRPAALAACLAGIRRLEGSDIETIVVVGPGGEATIDAITDLDTVATVILSPVRNLSVSRNLGIDAATAPLVAFLDDDAIPTERWLVDLLPHFDDPEVGAVGGPVFDYTGHSLQARYSRCNLAGDASVVLAPPIGGLTETPATATFDYPIGTNLIVRADAVASIGGFDEQYDYFHDETDLARRLLDAGWIVRVAAAGAVIHRYLPSATRGEDRVATDRRSILINRAYFAVRHQLPDEGVAAVRRDFDAFVAHHRAELESAGVDSSILDRFHEHAKEAHFRLDTWLQAPPSPRRHRHDPSSIVVAHGTRSIASPRRRHVLVASSSPSDEGLRRLAQALARDGHTVRLLDPDGGPHHRVDLEDDVWHHRLGDLPLPLPADLSDLVNPTDRTTWRSTASVAAEIDRIADLLWEPSVIVVDRSDNLAELLTRRDRHVVDLAMLARATSPERRRALLDET